MESATTKSKDVLLSHTINNIRIPLMLCVVLSHCMLANAQDDLFSYLQILSSQVLLEPCVPLFFTMSAFLFFWRIEKFDFRLFKSKLVSRVHSLLVPYLLWNMLVIVFFAFMHKFLSGYINPENQNVLDYSIKDFLMAFWNGSGGFPINYPLWFLRNLIVMTACTPLFYIIAYKTGWYRYAIMAGLAIAFFTISSNWIFTLFFYYVGVLIAKDRVFIYAFLDRIEGAKWINAIFLIIYSIVAFLFVKNKGENVFVVERILKLSGIYTYMLICIYWTKFGLRIKKEYGAYSFFIYLYHALPLIIIHKVMEMILPPISFINCIMVYLFTFVIIILSGILFYNIMSKFLPKTLSLLVGKRN